MYYTRWLGELNKNSPHRFSYTLHPFYLFKPTLHKYMFKFLVDSITRFEVNSFS